MNSLPVISIGGLNSPDAAVREQTVAELGRACREIGFFYVKDHGIPEALRQKAFARAAQFFEQPLADKEALSIKQSPHNRGYVAMADEKLNPESGADRKEAFNIGVDLPADHPDVVAGKPFRGVNFWPTLPQWREDMLEYFTACLQLGRLIHRGFSVDLGKPEEFFAPVLKNPIATLRLLHYPSAGHSDHSDNRADSGAGTHTDYGNVTILATDGVAGLQVRTRQGDWLEAPHLEGALVCNIGDCLMRWSNETYISTPHRVRAPLVERYSIAFFLEVDPDAVVDPRDIFPDQTPRFEPVSCADYLAMRLNATYDHRGEATGS